MKFVLSLLCMIVGVAVYGQCPQAAVAGGASVTRQRTVQRTYPERRFLAAACPQTTLVPQTTYVPRTVCVPVTNFVPRAVNPCPQVTVSAVPVATPEPPRAVPNAPVPAQPTPMPQVPQAVPMDTGCPCPQAIASVNTCPSVRERRHPLRRIAHAILAVPHAIAANVRASVNSCPATANVGCPNAVGGRGVIRTRTVQRVW